LYLFEGLSPPAAQLKQLPAAGIGLIEFIHRTRTSLFPSLYSEILNYVNGVSQATNSLVEAIATHVIVVVATSYIRSEKRHVERVMIVAKQAQKAHFLNG
jgi:hypothetical protein